MLDKIDRQPVEQFGMCGKTARAAKVSQCLDNPASEVMMPDAIDKHPRRQGVLP